MRSFLIVAAAAGSPPPTKEPFVRRFLAADGLLGLDMDSTYPHSGPYNPKMWYFHVNQHDFETVMAQKVRTFIRKKHKQFVHGLYNHAGIS